MNMVVDDVDSELAKEANCPVEKGAVVSLVQFYEGHHPAAFHFKAGDVITRIGTQPIGNRDDFDNWAQAAKDLRTYRMEVYRQQTDGRWKKLSLSYRFEANSYPVRGVLYKPDVPEEYIAMVGRSRLMASTRRSFPISGGDLVLDVPPLVHLGAHGQERCFHFVGHWFRPTGGKLQEANQGFFSIDGKAEKILFTSDNPQLLEVMYDNEVGLTADIKEAGFVHVVATLAGQTFKVPIRIVRLTIDKEDDSQEVLKAFGPPDREASYTVAWPDREIHDDLTYVPDPQQVISAKHWRYDRYPFLVISIVDGHVYNLGNSLDHPRLLEPMAIDGMPIKERR